MFLFEKYNTLKSFGILNKPLPKEITDNLRPEFILRPYQIESFSRFVYFYEDDTSDEKQSRPYHILYNMATGSGKTNIMAGLVLYLYKQGYRTFLFFVSGNTIIEKTKDNFLNPASSKYVFNRHIQIDSKEVFVKEIQSLDESDEDNINIIFTSIQQLHNDMELPKENSVSIEDFRNRKIVLLADEADNFNVATRNQNNSEGNWENTIQLIHGQNQDNILLEFTATMDLDTPEIQAKYEDKAIFLYDLKQFRKDGYSKDIELMKITADYKSRVLHALVLNLYRQVLAAANNINLKPVILFKAKRTIDESKRNKELFHSLIDSLSESDIERLKSSGSVDAIISKAFAFFERRGITTNEIVERTKANFQKVNCLSANNDAEKEKNQMLLNSLEDNDNPIRAVFAVNKLDRGWDVLNLFDIVRMYEDGDDGGRDSVGNTTRAEAQLIGRGARYFPFIVSEGQERYKRKYDSDRENDLRILETLYYHTINDNTYVTKIKQALSESGISDNNTVTKKLRLKESFKRTSFYQNARVVFNKRVRASFSMVNSLDDLSARKKNFTIELTELASTSVSVFEEEVQAISNDVVSKDIKLKDIPFQIIRFALSKNSFFWFSNLKKYCPNLKSLQDFINDEHYLGAYEITFKGSQNRLLSITKEDYLKALLGLLNSIENEIKEHAIEYEGSEFCYDYVRNVFGDKEISFEKDPAREEGQEVLLASKDWYAYNANYGTSEERAFIELFDRRYSLFTEKYEDIYIIRNERVISIIDEKGRKFEPDFLLYLRNKEDKTVVYQIFIEPKGAHLRGADKWKEDFLKKIKSEERIIQIESDHYHITGVPFYNQGNENEFKQELEQMLGIDN